MEECIDRINKVIGPYERITNGKLVRFTPVSKDLESYCHNNASHKLHNWCVLNTKCSSIEENIGCTAYTIQDSINSLINDKFVHLPNFMEVKICITELTNISCSYTLFIEYQPYEASQLAAYNNYNTFLRHMTDGAIEPNIPFLLNLFELRHQTCSCPRAKQWYCRFINYLLNFNGEIKLPPPSLEPNLEVINFWSNNRDALAQDTVGFLG